MRNVDAYIKTLITNGDAQEIIEEEQRKQELKERKSKSVDLVQEVVNPEEERKAFEKFLEKKQQIRRIK